MSSACWIWLAKTQPMPRNSPAHNAADSVAKPRKASTDMPMAPAIGGATTDTPGTNLAAINERPPQRRMKVSLWRTHESGEIEMRHSSRSTR